VRNGFASRKGKDLKRKRPGKESRESPGILSCRWSHCSANLGKGKKKMEKPRRILAPLERPCFGAGKWRGGLLKIRSVTSGKPGERILTSPERKREPFNPLKKKSVPTETEAVEGKIFWLTEGGVGEKEPGV